MEVYTSKKEKIVLYDDAFSSGGEGEVRKVRSAPIRFKNICVKIYYQKKRTPQLEKKINYMVANPPAKVQGSGFIIGWPLDSIHDVKGDFLGFVMPLAYSNSEQLIKLTAPKLSRKLGSEWFNRYDRANGVPTLISRLKLICNIAIPIHLLHYTNKYVLRDFKPENVLVTYDGRVTIVDMDSVQITNNGNLLFQAGVQTPNYIPPEYYDVRNVGRKKDEILNKNWDYFAIGVVFYQILMGLHPYVVTPYVLVDNNCNEIFHSIGPNLFPFGPNAGKVRSYPEPHNRFKKLHPELQKLFLRAFSSTPSERPEVKEWAICIKGLLKKVSPTPQPQPQPTPQAPITTPHPKPNPIPQNPKPVPQPKPQQQPQQSIPTKKEAGCFALFVSFIFPILGVIIYFNMKNIVSNPKEYLKTAFWGFCIQFILLAFLLG